MRPVNYTLDYLGDSPDREVQQLWQQVSQARATRRYHEAVRLCRNFTQRADNRSRHAALGFVFCYLGEVSRFMGTVHHREAVEAFGRGRLHFALDDSQVPNGRNEGIAHWSLAITLEDLAADWDTALRRYQSALDCLQRALKEAQASRSLTIRKRRELVEDLDRIHQLIQGDHDALLKQYAKSEPKLEGAVLVLESASETASQLVETFEATLQQTQAAAAKAAQTAEKLEETREQLVEEVQEAVDQTKAAATVTTQAATHLTQKLDEARERLVKEVQEATGQTQAAADETIQKLAQVARGSIQAADTARLRVTRAAEQIARLVMVQEQDEYYLEIPDDDGQVLPDEYEFRLFKRTETGRVIILRVPKLPEDASSGQVVGRLWKVT